jgi:hypothetical protein
MLWKIKAVLFGEMLVNQLKIKSNNFLIKT